MVEKLLLPLPPLRQAGSKEGPPLWRHDLALDIITKGLVVACPPKEVGGTIIGQENTPEPDLLRSEGGQKIILSCCLPTNDAALSMGFAPV